MNNSLSPIYDRVQFFGRRLKDYEQFLQFECEGLRGKRILDLAAGTASFAYEAANVGIDVVALDPCYRYSFAAVKQRAMSDFAEVKQIAESNRGYFNLESDEEFEKLWRIRLDAQEMFLKDFETGRAFGRYRSGTLPHLELESSSFDEVFCGHFLFLYANLYDVDFHIRAILEMLRIARERVRVYPVMNIDNRILEVIEQAGGKVIFKNHPNPIFKEGTQLMIIEKLSPCI